MSRLSRKLIAAMGESSAIARGYRIDLTPDENGTFVATCQVLPGMISFGNDCKDALRHAEDAIDEWIAAAVQDGRDIPRPEV